MSGGTPAIPHPTAADIELDRLSEAELWQRVVRLMEVAKQKQGMLAGQDKDNTLGVRCRRLCKHMLADTHGYTHVGMCQN